MTSRVSVNIISPEISGTDLRVSIPRWQHVYAVPFLPFYPLLAYAYHIKYDDWIKSEEWTFLACVLLGAGHALSFLVTRWSAHAKAWVTTRKVCMPITFPSHHNPNSIIRLVLSPRRTAFVSSQRLIADREKSFLSSNASPLIRPRTRSAINKILTLLFPSSLSLLAYSLTRRPRTLLSPIIANRWG